MSAAGPSPARTRRSRAPTAEHLRFRDDGTIPNSPLPLLVYRGAVMPDAEDPAATFEALFAANGWTRSWRNGIFPYLHYHSTAHEVLGLASGSARVLVGGEAGTILDLAAGDVVVLPAGTGHKLVEEGEALLVVGAYAEGRAWDILRGRPGQIEGARARIAGLPLPDRDPVEGEGGTLIRLWAQTAPP